MYRSMIIVVLSFALLLTGCQVSTKPRTFIEQPADARAVNRKAPRHALFRLYSLTPAAAEESQEMSRELLLSAHVRRGERVGFTRDDDGRLVAFAGRAKPMPLASPGLYLWEMQAASGQFDAKSTAVLVAVLVVGTAVFLVIPVTWGPAGS